MINSQLNRFSDSLHNSSSSRAAKCSTAPTPVSSLLPVSSSSASPTQQATQRPAAVAVLRGSTVVPQARSQCTHVCHAAVEDAAAAEAEAAAAATAAERRRLREQRRAARQQDAPEPDAAGASASADQQQQLQEQQAVGDQTTAATSAAAPRTSKPSSRLAARRQQRARQPGAGSSSSSSRRAPRVPDALVPQEVAEDDEDSSSASGSDADGLDDEDVIISSDSWTPAAGDDDELDDSSDQAAAAAAADSERDPEEAQTQLPQSVLQQAAASGQRPRQPRQQVQRQQQQNADGSSSQQQGQAQGQQQQQRGGGSGSSSRGGGFLEPLELSEASPMYLPVLTDEDLEADPPGHKSGYVAVIGRPNAGKSTLINAIVGQKLSIVTYKPQTTRHRVVGIASDTDYQMILFDTPGIMQEQRSKLDERMMAAVVSSIKAAEVIIAVVDSNDDPQEALAMFQPGPDWSGPPMAVLLNKCDLLSEEQIEELKQWYLTNCRAEKVFVGSALESSDVGVTDIKAWAVDKLPEGPTLYPKSMVSEQPERFFVSEIIREQIFVQYDQEIPYSCQVQIADFKERRGAKDYIQAVILVERETQAPIVLGRGGAAIKKLGSASRQQIEEFLGRKVYLELSVQVAPAWRQQADKLKDFGYYDALYVS